MARGVLAWLLLALAALPAHAWKKTVDRVRMRDGVGLHTVVWTPDHPRGALPILLLRTAEDLPAVESPAFAALARDGYIFAFQQVRGAGLSEGRFILCRPPREKPGGDGAQAPSQLIDETTDTKDTITWLLEHVRGHNGRVGMLGGGYAGWTQLVALTEPHPALRAISPEGPIVDLWMGDGFFHRGAFRLAPVIEWLVRVEGAVARIELPIDLLDRFEWFLQLGALAGLDSLYFKQRLGGWNDLVRHPSYDWFWAERSLARRLTRSTVPALIVGGWWDDQSFSGTMAAWDALSRDDPTGLHHLVLGPWRHRGAARDDGKGLGPLDFGQPTSVTFREKIQAPFFAYHLKGRGPLALPRVLAFQTGANLWEEHDRWPPAKDIQARSLYLRGYGRLSFLPPEKDGPREVDSYVSDPLRPVPHAPRPVVPYWLPPEDFGLWQLADQRFADLRPDVLSYVSPPLDEDVVISGRILARLFATTTGTDADWVVKLIDVWPENGGAMAGRQILIAGEILRAKFAKNAALAQPLVPNAVSLYELDLPSRSHRFLKGHRIMVQVQSSWFPLFDRNPQSFVDIFQAGETHFQRATQKVFRSRAYPSQLVVPVVRR